jgi:hypothetical protein
LRLIYRKQENKVQKQKLNRRKIVMKTRNILKQAAATLAALGLTIVLFTSQAGAQRFDRFADYNGGTSGNASDGIITQSAVSYAAEIEARRSSITRFELVTDAEAPLRLERWMVDKRYFVTLAPINLTGETGIVVSDSLKDSLEALLFSEKEEPMKLEAWMMDNECFPCKGRSHAGDLFTANLPVK